MSGATFGRFYLVTWLGERVTADLRRAVFEHILKLSPAFFEVTRTGEVISRLTNDTSLLETVVGSSASFALRNFLLMIGAFVLLAHTSPRLTVLVLIGVPVVFLPIIIAGRRVRRLSRASQDRLAEVAAYIDETFHEIRTVQAYVHEPVDRAGFGERVESQFDTARQRILVRAVMVASVIFLAFGAIGVILWVGGNDVVAGRLSPGSLSAFVFYAVLAAGAVGAIAEVMGELQRAAGAAERLLEADPLPLAQELARVLPVVREAVRWGVPISVDTYKAEVMQAVLDAGADIINDVWALRRGAAAEVVASHPRCGVCLMHMHREPQTMQVQPMEGDVVPQVRDFLQQAAHDLEAAGVARQRIALDPGVGFGKTVAQNFALLQRQAELLVLGYPLLGAWSRKSSLGAVLGTPEHPVGTEGRLYASVAAALLAVERGARVVRVHDVRATVDALQVWQAASA